MAIIASHIHLAIVCIMPYNPASGTSQCLSQYHTHNKSNAYRLTPSFFPSHTSAQTKIWEWKNINNKYGRKREKYKKWDTFYLGSLYIFIEFFFLFESVRIKPFFLLIFHSVYKCNTAYNVRNARALIVVATGTKNDALFSIHMFSFASSHIPIHACAEYITGIGRHMVYVYVSPFLPLMLFACWWDLLWTKSLSDWRALKPNKKCSKFINEIGL